MEDHMASSETMGTGSTSVTIATDYVETDPDLQVQCEGVKVSGAESTLADRHLRNR